MRPRRRRRRSAGVQMAVLVCTTITFMATIIHSESRPRVNAAKAMQENIVKKPCVDQDAPMAASASTRTSAHVQMDTPEPDARQVGHFLCSMVRYDSLGTKGQSEYFTLQTDDLELSEHANVDDLILSSIFPSSSPFHIFCKATKAHLAFLLLEG